MTPGKRCRERYAPICKLTTSRRVAIPSFNTTSPRRRIITASVLLLLVSTFIPYQFAFLVACVIQVATCARALRLVSETVSTRLLSSPPEPTKLSIAIRYPPKLLQLHPLNSTSHDLCLTNQSPCPGSLGSQPGGPLAHPIFFPS